MSQENVDIVHGAPTRLSTTEAPSGRSSPTTCRGHSRPSTSLDLGATQFQGPAGVKEFFRRRGWPI